jgi:hypothetical protein
MLTRAIFIRPDSELIRKSVWACINLFVDEEKVHMAQTESWKNQTKTLTDSTRKRHKKEDSTSFV